MQEHITQRHTFTYKNSKINPHKRHVPAKLLHKYEIHRSDEAQESSKVVPMQLLTLEHNISDDCEDNQRHDLLNDLKLHKREWAAIAFETNLIGRHLHAIFKEGYDPRKGYHTYERPSVADVHLVKLQMTVPCKCHEHICPNEQENRIKSVKHI